MLSRGSLKSIMDRVLSRTQGNFITHSRKRGPRNGWSLSNVIKISLFLSASTMVLFLKGVFIELKRGHNFLWQRLQKDIRPITGNTLISLDTVFTLWDGKEVSIKTCSGFTFAHTPWVCVKFHTFRGNVLLVFNSTTTSPRKILVQLIYPSFARIPNGTIGRTPNTF